MITHKKAIIAAACMGALGAGLLAGCSTATDLSANLAKAPSSAQASKLGSDEFYRVSATIVNNSKHSLTLTTAQAAYDNGKNGGNWNDRPAATLAPGAKTTAVVYSAALGQGLDVVYHSVQDPSARVKMVAQDPTTGANNTNDTTFIAPLAVQGKITNGRQCTVTFTITGNLS